MKMFFGGAAKKQKKKAARNRSLLHFLGRDFSRGGERV